MLRHYHPDREDDGEGGGGSSLALKQWVEKRVVRGEVQVERLSIHYNSCPPSAVNRDTMLLVTYTASSSSAGEVEAGEVEEVMRVSVCVTPCEGPSYLELGFDSTMTAHAATHTAPNSTPVTSLEGTNDATADDDAANPHATTHPSQTYWDKRSHWSLDGQAKGVLAGRVTTLPRLAGTVLQER
jgi:hypothetical protein